MNMIRRPGFLVLFLLMSLLRPDVLWSARITIDSEEQFEFARQAMEKGDHVRAVTEFERLIYFFPQDRKVPEARYLIGLCHLKARDYERAREVLREVYRAYRRDTVGGKALLLIGESYYLQGVSKEAERYFQQVLREYRDPSLINPARYRTGWSRMHTHRWEEASRSFQSVDRESPLYPSARELSEMSMKGADLPLKSPVAAGVMAGALPGLGHAYCDRYKDGLVAFLLNGLFIWGAAESFHEGHDVLGGILTFLELGWYTGNIYSAVNCAHKHNRSIRSRYLRNLPDNFDISFFTSEDRQVGLVLKIDF